MRRYREQTTRYSFLRCGCCASTFLRSWSSSTRTIFFSCSTTLFGVETDPRPTVHVCHYHESGSRPRARIAQPSPSPLLRRMSCGHLSEAAKGGPVTAGCKRGKRSSLRFPQHRRKNTSPEKGGRVVGECLLCPRSRLSFPQSPCLF